MFGDGFDPIKVNPYRIGEQPGIEDLKAPEVKQMESRVALKAMGRALKSMCPKKPKQKPKPGG